MLTASLSDAMRARNFISFVFLYTSVGYLIRDGTHAALLTKRGDIICAPAWKTTTSRESFHLLSHWLLIKSNQIKYFWFLRVNWVTVKVKGITNETNKKIAFYEVIASSSLSCLICMTKWNMILYIFSSFLSSSGNTQSYFTILIGFWRSSWYLLWCWMSLCLWQQYSQQRSITGIREGALNDSYMCSFVKQHCQVSLRVQLAGLQWLPGSPSVLSTVLWDRGRYGTLRGTSRGRYVCCIGTPSPGGHQVEERERGLVWNRKTEYVCVYAKMDEALALRQWSRK